MHPSNRNRFTGQVKAIQTGSAVTRVLVQVGEFELESVITGQEADKLELCLGKAVTVEIKTTDVLLQRCDTPARKLSPAKQTLVVQVARAG